MFDYHVSLSEGLNSHDVFEDILFQTLIIVNNLERSATLISNSSSNLSKLKKLKKILEFDSSLDTYYCHFRVNQHFHAWKDSAVIAAPASSRGTPG